MPKISSRQDTLKWVRQNLYLSILLHSSDSEDFMDDSDEFASTVSSGQCSPLLSESDLELESSSDSDRGVDRDPTNVEDKPSEWMELHAVLESERFWIERTKRFQAKEFLETLFYEVIPNHLFRQMTRMNKEPFQKLVRIIETNFVYHNASMCPQAPVCVQLVACLDRLGHSGNGACLKHILLLWGISVGSVVNYTRRLIAALEDCIGDILKWPDAHNRQQIAQAFGMKGFPGCLGLIDGTTIPLAQNPANSGETYWEQKCRYLINAQVVCDNNKHIIFIYAGSPGSCSDITCLRRSALWDRIHPDSLFNPGEYILGDSGYVNAPHMVYTYKMTMNAADQEDFNFTVAKCRVINEHTIGILKMRWFSLREMRLQLNKNNDHGWLCRWIVVCALLHNYVHDANDEWTDEDMADFPMEVLVEIPHDKAQNQTRSRASMAARGILLERVKRTSLQFHRGPGGCLWRGNLS